MNLIDTTGVEKVSTTTLNEIGKLGFYTDLEFNALSTETIQIIVERNGADNINITKGAIPLKDYILALTYGKDAIGSFPTAHYETFRTAVICELSDSGNIELVGSDKIVISLANLQVANRYVLDGIVTEDTNPDTSDIYILEEKIISADQKDVTISVDNSEVVVLDDLQEITEVNIMHLNGRTTKHSMRELRMISIDNDPLAYVKNNGNVVSSYIGKIQLDTKRIKSINIVKSPTVQVRMICLFDVQMQNLGLIKH